MNVITSGIFLFLIQFFLESSFPIETQKMEVDDLGYVYFIKNQTIEKRETTGHLLFRNSELNYGVIDHFDLTNPLQPFVYYKTQNKLLVLDNTLSQQGDLIDLNEKYPGQIEAVAGSKGDAYWLWNASNSELIKVDRQFLLLSKSGNMSQMLNKTFHPHQILERGSHVFLVDSVNGIFEFDIYGTYRKHVNLLTNQAIQFENDYFITIKNDSIHFLSINQIESFGEKMPSTKTEQAFLKSNRLFTLNENGFSLYLMKN
jgi:hypothetical protein